jgi:hypothetical protein
MPIDKDEYQKRMRLIDRAFLLLTALFFAILISFMVLLINVRDISHKAVRLSNQNAILLKENDKRIKQDKIAVIAACKHTYSGIKDVFEIYFPKHTTSAKQERDIKRFNARIEELKLACDAPRNQ